MNRICRVVGDMALLSAIYKQNMVYINKRMLVHQFNNSILSIYNALQANEIISLGTSVYLINLTEEDLVHLALLGIKFVEEDRSAHLDALFRSIKTPGIDVKVENHNEFDE